MATRAAGGREPGRMDPAVRREFFDLHALLCKAIADPKRLLIIDALRDRTVSVGELVRRLEMSQSNVSQHLAILRDRGVVDVVREGASHWYRLRDPRIAHAVDLLRAAATSPPIAGVASAPRRTGASGSSRARRRAQGPAGTGSSGPAASGRRLAGSPGTGDGSPDDERGEARHG